MEKISKFFNFNEKQKDISKEWENSKQFHYDVTRKCDFSVDTPPPTVSGLLHMGHVFSYVQCDIIARYHRILGENVFYPIGFDDNGLPTERLVEKASGKKVGKNCSRSEFQDECFNVIHNIENDFESLFKSLGISYDWNLKYQTISKTTEEIVIKSFADLYKKDLIYIKHSPVYWDTEDKTALSQADLEDKEIESVEYFVPFRCSTAGTLVQIMTTRPELIVSCLAVLYHPSDERYKNIKTLKTPIFNNEVPLIADDSVKIEKGTGVVMCCSYGDWQDVEWIKKHNLTPNVTIQDNGQVAHEFYKNTEKEGYLYVKDARKKITEELQKQGLILKQNNILHAVKCAERSGKPIEIINKKQIYVKTLPFKDFLLKCVNELEFKPSHMKIRLQKWIEGLNQDWCISRNRYFGIEIPYYSVKINKNESKSYDFIFPDGIFNTPELVNIQKTEFGYTAEVDKSILKYKVNDDTLDINSKTQIEIHFMYVFDTWFTSSLTPQIAQSAANQDITPFSIRTQAHEIIRTWAFYTLLKSVLHSCGVNDGEQEIAKINKTSYTVSLENLQKQKYLPWKTVALSGWCLASDKTKMSKSKGNVINPVDIIKQYGADVVRLWCSNTQLGTDSAFSEDRLEFAQKFTTKIWNLLKFVKQVEVVKIPDFSSITNETDLWVLEEMKLVINSFKEKMTTMDYFSARKELDKFFWNTICDNYIEFVKIRYYGKKAFIYKDAILTESQLTGIICEQSSAIATTYTLLHGITILYSPFCPFITHDIQKHIPELNYTTTNNINDFLDTLNSIKTNCGNFSEWTKIVEDFRKHIADNNVEAFYNKMVDVNNMPLDIKNYIKRND